MAMRRRKRNSAQVGPTDRDLVGLILSGDEGAVMLLVRRYDGLLYRTARSILRDDTEAEDAVQESLLLAYRGLANFRREARLSTWLVRIVVNVALGRLRKRVARTDFIQFADDASQRSLRSMDDPPEQPDEAMARADVLRALETEIDALPDHYRVVFVLRAVQELQIEDIAEVLDIPKATVRSRFSRARRLLRASLPQQLDTAPEDVFPFGGERCDRMVRSVLAQLQLAGLSAEHS